MTQRNKNLRNVVDDVFRQSSPATPQKIVQDVLSDESRDSSSMSAVPKRANALPTAKFIAPETSITLPAINVTPIETDDSKSLPKVENQSFWSVFTTIVLLIALAFLVWNFWSPIKDFIVETFSVTDAPTVAAENTTVVSPPNPTTLSPTPLLPSTPLPTSIPTSTVMEPKKNVTFDESKNTIRYIDTSAAPSEMQMVQSPVITEADGAKKMTTQATTVFQFTPKEATLESLQLSLDNLAKTNLDLQAQRDAAVNATNQREQGACMRLSEKQQYSLTDRMAPIVDADARDNVQTIYDRDGGNSVVGNRGLAPFVTFAPGEEPFDGMVPDYDEAEHGNNNNMPPPLQSGKPHGILELINDHCMRTGKPMPKAGDRSALDIMSKKDTGTFMSMRVADSDGHYLQSQKKQFELARINASAIKKIYADKHAASAGQILDRGDAILTQFAGAQGVDAVQYLNINSL